MDGLAGDEKSRHVDFLSVGQVDAARCGEVTGRGFGVEGGEFPRDEIAVRVPVRPAAHDVGFRGRDFIAKNGRDRPDKAIAARGELDDVAAEIAEHVDFLSWCDVVLYDSHYTTNATKTQECLKGWIMAKQIMYLDYTKGMAEDDVAFAEGLAEARPAEDVSRELGWSAAKMRRKLKDPNVLLLASANGLATVHGVLVPRSLRVISQLLEGVCLDIIEDKKGNVKKIHIPVTPAVRLQAAQVILKIAAFEEFAAPKEDAGDALEGASPDRLRALLDVIEGKLSDLAAPVSAPNQAIEDAEIAEESNDYSVLD